MRNDPQSVAKRPYLEQTPAALEVWAQLFKANDVIS